MPEESSMTRVFGTRKLSLALSAFLAVGPVFDCVAEGERVPDAREQARKKIEEKLDSGWTFDANAWAASQARHAND